ncbi:hypothetical protein K461DRAFT_290110 [Myriangium duriaei CBS 260.36]|uniref:Rad21/Rec8-like protein N-terminal domain-containing protein n=1 Tax=Myriangium duriaei CBS 260.36 TaxID=1168546 RepID=A0A9P4JC05_9PEZI|nr:hypothetical protein K461DRAFT_290110 [Myriangium duriaei CBS 260.36]
MFYSETLLQKTGPLAKVWLAANVERKLTKGDCLRQNITKDVRNIVNDEQAPLALRLTSQLLLGVVRIYSRKARYLLDDCNEALVKIKLAFRPGNVDLPSTQSHVANPSAINIPDAITELDLFAPVPDLEELLFGRGTSLAVGSQTELDWGTSQILPDSVEESQSASQLMELEEDDLGLDLGQDVTAPSIEIGRRAESPRRGDTLFEDDLGLDLGLGDTTIGEPTIVGDDGPQFDDDLGFGDIAERNKAALEDAARRERESSTPLSELGEAQVQEIEGTFQLPQEEDETAIQAPQRAPKRRRILAMDSATELANSQVKNQPRDRSGILLPHANKLPRDPIILALLNMQRSGAFVSSILGDATLARRGLAPELRGVLSLEVVRRAGDLKRKRPTPLIGGAAEEEDEPLPAGDDMPFPEDTLMRDDNDLPPSPGGPAFDETTLPPVAPGDSGPVSLATKHTVHMLRQRFAPEDPTVAPDAETRKSQSVLFADLCPEQRTSRADATKLFFETLVLATKDAVRVQQDPTEGLGAELRIRAKRGLWGAWAEAGVGHVEDEDEDEVRPQTVVEVEV